MERKTYLLKLLLIVQTVALVLYTVLVINKDGWDLLPVFISNITAISWSGQFNLDFNCYLILSGLWIMWRNKFSTKAILLGSMAMVLGIVIFAPYLFYLLTKERGNIDKVLLGKK